MLDGHEDIIWWRVFSITLSAKIEEDRLGISHNLRKVKQEINSDVHAPGDSIARTKEID